MKHNEPHLVHYTVGDVETELAIQPQNYVERRLVLCAHDEMTAQEAVCEAGNIHFGQFLAYKVIR